VPWVSSLFCSSIQPSITLTMPGSLHCLRASSSLAISALICPMALGESMDQCTLADISMHFIWRPSHHLTPIPRIYREWGNGIQRARIAYYPKSPSLEP
jgi:hypothetical protein